MIDDFTLRLHQKPDGGLQVQVLDFSQSATSPQIVGESDVTHQPAKMKITKYCAVIADAICKQGTDENVARTMRDLGCELWKLLFPPLIWDLFVRRLRYARQRNTTLQLRLQIEAEEFAAWPYEYLYVDNLVETMTSGFVALNPFVSLVRVSNPQTQGLPLAPADILQILVVYCNLEHDIPTTVNRGGQQYEVHWQYLNSLEFEHTTLLNALQGLQREGLVQVEQLCNPRPTDLLDRIRANECHVLIYLGHAYYNVDEVLGANLTCGLVLDNGFSQHSYLEAKDLTPSFENRTIRLAVLNACETMRQDDFRSHRGTAWALAEKGIAAIGMHFEQPDTAGLLLGDAFWRGVAHHESIDSCLMHAREVLVTSFGEKRPEWGNAALIMNSPDGRLLAYSAEIDRANYQRFLQRRYLGAP